MRWVRPQRFRVANSPRRARESRGPELAQSRSSGTELVTALSVRGCASSPGANCGGPKRRSIGTECHSQSTRDKCGRSSRNDTPLYRPLPAKSRRPCMPDTCASPPNSEGTRRGGTTPRGRSSGRQDAYPRLPLVGRGANPLLRKVPRCSDPRVGPDARGCGLTACASAAGRMPAPSEFYAPLSASGGPDRAEPGAPRACQLHARVRPRSGYSLS